MSDIFISYASEDKSKARQLFEAFEKQGWSVFWDRDISTGKSFHEVIDEELAQAKAVVVLWSEMSVKKNWVLEEAQDGLERNVLIPVFIEQVKPPRGFRLIQTASLIGWDGSPNAQDFIRLVQDIAGITVTTPDLPVSSSDDERHHGTYATGLELFNIGRYGEAYPLLLKAAKNGYPIAQSKLGYMYETGRGVTQSNDEAFMWYQKSAKQGYPTAQYNLDRLRRLR